MQNPNRRAAYYFLSGLLVFTLVAAFGVFSPFLRSAAFALVLSVGFYPVHSFVRRYVRRPNLAASFTTVLLLIAIVVPVVVMGRLISIDARKIVEYVQNADRDQIYAQYELTQDKVLLWLSDNLGVGRDTVSDKVKQLPAEVGRLSLIAGSAVVGGAAGFVTQTAFTFLILFFFFRDGEMWLEDITGTIPLRPERIERLFKIVQDTIVASLYGIMGVALVQGILVWIGLWIAGFGAALLLGMLAGICSVIPLVGTGLVWGPAGVYLLLAHQTGKGLFVLIWGLLIVNPTDNIIRPLVLYGRIKVHPLLLIFSILGGILKFGLLGAFIGPLLVALIIAAIQMLREEAGDLERKEEVQAQTLSA